MADTHILSQEQRAKYEQIRRTKGAQAAQAFKDGLINTGRAAGPGAGAAQANLTTQLQDKLAPGQAEILEGGSALTRMGQDLAKQQLGNFKAFDGGGTPIEERQRMEELVFGHLTRGMDKEKANEKAQLEQTLYNRGVALNPSDPQYQQHMDALNERYDTRTDNAKAQAFREGEAATVNNFNMGLAGHQQGMSDLGTLQGMGTGIGATELDMAFTQLGQQGKLSQAQAAELRRRQSGGGAAAPAQPASPFNTSTPPGV